MKGRILAGRDDWGSEREVWKRNWAKRLQALMARGCLVSKIETGKMNRVVTCWVI